MSDRINLSPTETLPKKSNKRWLRNGIAIIVVIITTTIFAILSPKTEIIKNSLSPEGCGQTEVIGSKCIFKSGEKELTLRECTTDKPCDKSEYILGKKDKNTQYVLVKSLVFGQSIQIMAIDIEAMNQSEIGNAFYTEVSEECKSKNSYEEKCFSFPVNEEQRKDIAEQNKRYNTLLKDYSK
jgi:hypothetical protein